VRAALESASAGQLPEPSARLLQRLSSLQDNVRAWLPDARALSVADILRLTTPTSPSPPTWAKTCQRWPKLPSRSS
jgi:NADH:ubiquinone oxidoreductase subunit E